MGSVHQAGVHNPAVVEGNCHFQREVCVTTGCTLVQMHVTDWAEVQKEDLKLSTVLNWLKAQKKTDFLAEHTSSEEGRLILGETENLLLFVVARAHCVTTLNGYHRDVGHQGHDCTLSLLWEHFWWPGMTNQMQQSVTSCTHCLQHEGDLSKVPQHPMVATTPMDLLHVDFTSIEMTLELNRPPKVTSLLVFQDHFVKHVMAYMIPDQTAKTVTNFLYQCYISIFGTLARLLSNWGANFMSSIIDEMCKHLSMKKLQTMP